MRRIVIGKMLIVVLWLLYLVVGLTQPSGNGGSANGVAGTSRCSQQQPPTHMTRGGHSASRRVSGSTFSLARKAFVPTLRSADYALAPARRTAQARPHRCRIPLDN